MNSNISVTKCAHKQANRNIYIKTWFQNVIERLEVFVLNNGHQNGQIPKAELPKLKAAIFIANLFHKIAEVSSFFSICINNFLPLQKSQNSLAKVKYTSNILEVYF